MVFAMDIDKIKVAMPIVYFTVYHTFVEIDHEIISTVILLLPLIYSRMVVVSYKRKYVHKLLVNRLLKSAQEKVWLSELTVPQ